MATLTFLAGGIPAAQSPIKHLDLQQDQAERKVKDLAREFAQILAPLPLESQLQAKCGTNCTEIVDSEHGLTVAQELENIEVREQTEMAHVGAEIQRQVNGYIPSSVSGNDGAFNRVAMIGNLSHILSGVTDQPPLVFILASRQGHALLIFDNIETGTMGPTSSYAAITAFNFDGQKLTLSDSTDGDMDGYGRIDIKELPSPVQGEIWLLVSGCMTGANGPNCRMRVLAYDGKKFRTVWVPANVWGTFTMQVANNGFRVRGDDYPSNRHVDDRYALGEDGLYLMTTGVDLAPPSK